MSLTPMFRGKLQDVDPAIYDLIQREQTRQDNTIILIASESASHDAIHEAIASPFAHVYAEGYPREASRRQTQEQILDVDAEVAYYRRNSDPRYYKGVEYADVLEALCRRRAAELFAANGIDADDMYINVQSLSGGPANSAVYTALIQPGDTVMGLKLSDGGHLSHGATVNRSGQVYRSVSYVVDSDLQAINYDAIEEMALREMPNIIVAGFSAYPLVIDWQRFRDIADEVGAYLLADIAHISGLVATGVHPSPIGIADVVSTTTHKSLCGPRGAMIMTHRKDLAPKIDKAVFPGEQGGPHLNTMTALAVALKLAATDEFRDFQHQIAANAARLAEMMNEHGLRVAFDKSENHLLLVDCRSVRIDGVPLTGDYASRILDLANIVINRNNIPGDKSAMNPWGIRLGMVWPTQRGFGQAETDKLALAMATIMKGCTPFYYLGAKGKQFRAKVDAKALATGRKLVAELTGQASPVLNENERVVHVRGEKAGRLLNYALTCDVLSLKSGESCAAYIYTKSGYDDNLSSELVIGRTGDRYDLIFHRGYALMATLVRQWLADLSDGYIHFGDLHAKLPGPVVVSLREMTPEYDLMFKVALDDSNILKAPTKPYFIGQEGYSIRDELPSFEWNPPAQNVKRTSLYDRHVEMSGNMVPFAGYDMPVWYTSVSDEHEVVRKAAGLFDVSHMGVFEVSGAGSAEFLNTVCANDVYTLSIGESQYSFLLATDGRVIDDLLIYRTAADTYMLVVNAANNDEDWAWLNAVNNRSVRISDDRPDVMVQHTVTLRDLRDPASGAEQLVDIALQGPKSYETLSALTADDVPLFKLKWGWHMQTQLAGFDVIVSRTGYTGEREGYELFVHPDNVVALWDAILEAGQSFGVQPCGLASRDSTRTEAGLPLHGHELAGSFAITPFEAGFGKFVKVYKPFFVGRTAMLDNMLTLDRQIVRFRMEEKGVRRPQTGDPIVDKRGKVVGHVTSCAIDSDGYLLGQAIVPKTLRRAKTVLSLYQTGGGKSAIKGSDNTSIGARLPLPNNAIVLSRFPKK